MLRLVRATNIYRPGPVLPLGQVILSISTNWTYHSVALVGGKLPVCRMNGIWGQPIRGVHTYGLRGTRFLKKTSFVISTLKREKLQPSDFVDISEISLPSINTPAFPKEEGTQMMTGFPGHPLFHASRIRHPGRRFPKNCRGFLYYYIPPGQSPISGELRFRLTPTSNPTSFDEGHNLTTSDGFYWRMQFHAMPKALRNLALRDQPIAPAVATEWKHIFEVDPKTTVLHYLEQPFLLDFSTTYITMVCVHNDDVRRILFYNPTRDTRELLSPKNHSGVATYRGSAVVRFELSTLPEHAGANVILIRILKILKPVECVLPGYDGYKGRPEEGSLVTILGSDGVRRAYTINLGRNDVANVALKIFLPGEHDFRPRNPDHIKSTLDPGRLQASDAFILTEGRLVLYISFGNGSTSVTLPYFLRGHHYRHHTNSFAFLYYHKPLSLPDTAGEIRIRLTSTPNPATFDQGHDLRRPSGGLWNIPLLKLVSHAQFDLLCQQLVHDQLVTPTLLLHCKKLIGHRLHIGGYGQRTLHSLWQPFRINFSRTQIGIDIIGQDSIRQYFLTPCQLIGGPEQPTGEAWVQFEKSRAKEDINKRVVVLRVLEAIEPGESGILSNAQAHPVQPSPYDSLVMKTTLGGNVKLYKANVDRCALRLLWPNAQQKERGEPVVLYPES